MDTIITRRRALGLGAATIGGTLLYAANSRVAADAAVKTPWEWKELPPESIQERAYASAWAKVGCMYGVLEAVLGTLGDKYGAPYNTFPVDATVYGSGGIGGIGSLCGTVNAAGMLFGLFAKSQEEMFALCGEMSLWYEKAPLPVYKPKDPRHQIPDVTSVSGSNLCHVSSTRWANASGLKLMTPQHFERCNRLVADAAVKIVSMLNEYSRGKMTYKEKLNAFSEGCQACHGPAGVKANVASSMSCDTCHEDPH
ncbi:MAG: hypothetical protein GXY47_00140 [Acidobacteria bacterium]|nr:hypothetical protein [Acidobacteriota bacterium]